MARLEGIHEQIKGRLRRIAWIVGVSMAWSTVLTGVAVGIVLTYG
jgi:hypothetical protein